MIAALCKTPSGYPCMLLSVTQGAPQSAFDPGLWGVTPSAYGCVSSFVTQGAPRSALTLGFGV